MKYLKLFEEIYFNEHGEEKEYEPLFVAQTKGGRYKIEVFQSELDKKRDKYSINEFTNGRSSGHGSGYNKNQMNVRLNSIFDGSLKIDNINYQVISNEGGFEILPIEKDTPYKPLNYFNKYFGIHPSTGEPFDWNKA